MLKNLTLTRPLAVFDLETTGTDPAKDRIVEICVHKYLPDGSCDPKTRRLNPTIPIPPDATAIHKITDADVANAPTFQQVAKGLCDFLAGCDLCGFNLIRFDLRLLRAEFQRAGIDFPLEGRAIIDPMMIFHKYEPRDLSAASRFYLNREHENAHSAEADVNVTTEILNEMLNRYPELPRTPAGMQELLKPEMAVDVEGKFRTTNGVVQFTFGEYRGQPLDVVAKSEKGAGFIRWMLGKDFHEDTKRVAREALTRAGHAG